MLRPDAGRLLVATPVIGDPNFERSVVLLLEHEVEGGTAGVVLNRPSTTDLLEPLPAWDRLAAHPAVVFSGGPVDPERAIALARAPRAVAVGAEGFRPVLGDVGTLDLNLDPDAVGADVEQVRIFAGYAGWGPGQLAAELEAGAWWVVEGSPRDAVATDPTHLWRTVLARQPGELQLFAGYPDDPSLN